MCCIVRLLGWDMDCGKVWDQLLSRKAILFHQNDSLIPPHLNLVKSIAADKKNATDVIELTTPFEPAHMYPLMGMVREKPIVVEFAKQVLGLN